MSATYPIVPASPYPPIPPYSGVGRARLVLHPIPMLVTYTPMPEIGYCRWEYMVSRSANRMMSTPCYMVRWNDWTRHGSETWMIGATR